MSNIDEEIRKALSEEDKLALDSIDEGAGLLDMIGMTLTGKQAWLSYYMWALGFVTFFAGLYFLNQFLATSDIKLALGWALAIILCLCMMIIIKILSWMQMQKLEIMREIKRLEMRIMLNAENHQSGHD